MKRLFIYLLFAALCGTIVAQVAVPPPPRVGASGETSRSNVRVKSPLTELQKQTLKKVTPKHKRFALTGKKGHPVAVAPKINLTSVSPIEGDMARIILDVQSDFGDGSGYQLLLDDNAVIYDYFYQAETFDAIYSETDYSVPENAGWLDGFLRGGEKQSVDIPEGIYDYIIFNPTPSAETTYYPLGDALGDNVYFVGGHEYVFTITCDGNTDNSTLTNDSPVDLSVADIISPLSGDGLIDAEKVTVTVKNIGTEPIKSFTARCTVNDGTPLVETVEHEIGVGESFDYTFTGTFDFSEPKMHKIEVYVECEGEASISDDNTFVKYVNNPHTVPAPYSCDFDGLDDLAEWVFVDANNDGITWRIDQNAGQAVIMYNTYLATDDYLVTANPISLKAGKNNVSVIYTAQSSEYFESFEIWYGKTSDVSEMTMLARYENIDCNYDGAEAFVNFDLQEDGEYYFAIRGTSEMNRVGIIIMGVEISEGVYAGTPDIVVDQILLPVSSCSLGQEELSVRVFNKGSGDISRFTLSCDINDKPVLSQTFDVTVAVDDTVTVTFDTPVDFSEVALYNLQVTATDVVVAVGDKEERYTGNNVATTSVRHFTPAELPFVTDFSNADQRYDWFGADSWGYDEYYASIYCGGSAPLVSRGVNLEAGKTYRLSYNYMAGVYLYVMTLYDSYKVLYGLDGKDPLTEWSVLESFEDVYTDDAFTDNEIEFTVPENGLYSFAFYQSEYTGYFNLTNISIREVTSHDVSVGNVEGFPTMVPPGQMKGMTVNVSVKNTGIETVSGRVDLTINDVAVGSCEFADLASRESVSLPVELYDVDVTPGMSDVVATATLDGQADEAPGDNVSRTSVNITDGIMAYDHVTDGFYADNAVGLLGETATIGIPFHFVNATILEAFDLGWGIANDQTIGLHVYKWDASAQPDEYGFLPVGEELLNTTASQGTEIGQVVYPLDNPLRLEAGDYILAVTYYDYGLAADRLPYGSMYLIDDYYGEGYLSASDQSSSGLGTPAIRAVLTDITTGIGSVESGLSSFVLYPNPVSETLTIVSESDEISEVSIYSASGAAVCKSVVNGNRFSYNVSGLTPGVYFAKVATRSGTEVRKFVVK